MQRMISCTVRDAVSNVRMHTISSHGDLRFLIQQDVWALAAAHVVNVVEPGHLHAPMLTWWCWTTKRNETRPNVGDTYGYRLIGLWGTGFHLPCMHSSLMWWGEAYRVLILQH